MPNSRVPVFWVCGASGAGKSVAAWRLFGELAASGVVVAYVDIDQLGMLYPAQAEDPARHLLKAQSLVALLPGYAEAGAQVVVVSGVVDPSGGPDSASTAGLDLTLCLLSPDRSVLGQRLRSRGWGEEMVELALAEDSLLRLAPFTDAVIDTAGLSVAETAARLQARVRFEQNLAEPMPRQAQGASSVAPIPVRIITGGRATGTSTVGFELATRRWRAGHPTGFFDFQQLGFLAGPGADDDLRSNLAAVQLITLHSLFADRGATMMIVSAHLSDAGRTSIRNSLPQATADVVRLRADVATLTAHVQARFAGNGPQLAGDDLVGAARNYQRTVVAAALQQQEQMDSTANNERVTDVTDRSSTDVADEAEAT